MSESEEQLEFKKMQEQAAERMRQMQRQAAAAQKQQSKFFEQEDPRERFVRETLSGERRPENPAAPKILTGRRASDPLRLLGADSDLSLILPLILLLTKEDADEMLILALLYIML